MHRKSTVRVPTHIAAALRGAMGALIVAVSSSATSADVLQMPTIVPVPPTATAPLSSAERPGTEYSDLAAAGYVEEEYYLSGVAPAITAAGETLFQVPYITRILVRKPKDPSRFNGTAVIEPFSWIGERGAGWIVTRDYLLREGYAYVGYTLSINKPERDPKTTTDPNWMPEEDPPNLNLEFMRRFDYARYAPLGSYYDSTRFQRGGHADPFVPHSQGVGAQLALLLKSNATNGPLRGMVVERVYVNSWAVTAQVWMDYLDQGRHQQWRMSDGRPLIDAYMTGRMASGDVGGEKIRLPRKMPQDAPFVTIYTQSESMYEAMAGNALPPDTDRPKLRYYEVTGTPHLRLADLGTDEVEVLPSQGAKGHDPRCQHLYDEPAEVVMAALLDGMDRWVREGTPMLKAPRVVRQGAGIARDRQTGNMVGGLRPAWIQVPAAVYWTEQEAGCGSVYDTKVPYAREKLKKLYRNYANYARRFEAAKAVAVGEGHLLPEDAARLAPIAKPSDF